MLSSWMRIAIDCEMGFGIRPLGWRVPVQGVEGGGVVHVVRRDVPPRLRHVSWTLHLHFTRPRQYLDI